MPREKSPGKATTRRYTEEEKAQAVRLVRQLRRDVGTEHGTVQRVADQLGYGVETIRRWVKRADVDEGVKPGRSSEDAAKIKELEQEVKELRRAQQASPTGVGIQYNEPPSNPGRFRTFGEHDGLRRSWWVRIVSIPALTSKALNELVNCPAPSRMKNRISWQSGKLDEGGLDGRGAGATALPAERPSSGRGTCDPCNDCRENEWAGVAGPGRGGKR